MKFKTLIQTTRPSFLILAPVCVLLGYALSVSNSSALDTRLLWPVLIGAVLAHISVNTLNEYYDFKSGLDLHTDKTPFSGGSGALPGNPQVASLTLTTGLLTLLLTIVIGLYLVIIRGTQIIPVGLLGIMLVVSYTQWLNRVPFLCLLAPGLGFGMLMVVGTQVILTGDYTFFPWLVSLVPFFLMNNLLLLNQYPDIKADASVGRKTFPIVFGVAKSNQVYALFAISAYLLIIAFVVNGDIPRVSFVALLPLPLALYALAGAIKYADKIGQHSVHMAANVAAAILTPLLLALAMILG